MRAGIVGYGLVARATARALTAVADVDVLTGARGRPSADPDPSWAPGGVRLVQHDGTEASARAWIAALDVCVLAADTIDASHCRRVGAACLDTGVPMVPALGLGEVALVGPVVVAGRGPCLECVDLRVRAATGRPALVGPYPLHPWLPERIAEHVAGLIGGLVGGLAGGLGAGPGAGPATGAGEAPEPAELTHLGWDGRASRHPVLRSHACLRCSRFPPSAAFAEPRELEVWDDASADPERIVGLQGLLVDELTGVVRRVVPYEAGPTEPRLAHAVASVADPLWAETGGEVRAGGNHLDPTRALAAALGESLDRLASTPPDPALLSVAPYDAVAGHALDPCRFDLFHPATRAQPGFPYPPASGADPRTWAWGYSIGEERPVLVPAARVFAPLRPATRADAAEPGNVSGCATGSSLAEATLGGLLEVVERDAFTIAWATRVPMTGIAVDADAPADVRRLIKEFAEAGIEARCCTATLDWGVPLVVALARSSHPGDPARVVAAAAHPDLSSACRSALQELSANLSMVRHAMTEAPGPQTIDPAGVVTQEDHARLFARPDMTEHLRAWWEPEEVVALPQTARRPAGDLLREVAGRIVASGGDVVVVDVSQPGLAERGLWTVKVIVPEAYPMTFDSRWPQHGGARLREAPVAAGLLGDQVPFEELNPVPHPFP